MKSEIVTVNKIPYGSDFDIWENDEMLRLTFYTYDEYYKFWESLAETYPEGIPEEYIYQKLQQIRYFKMVDALAELEKKNMVIKSQNEDGEDVWSINPDANSGV